MTFDSFDFALFLPIVLLGYWALARWLRWQNVLILACSYLFYGWWDYRFLLLIILTTLVSYSCALGIASAQTEHRRRLCNGLNVVVNLSVLAFFKYCNFFVSNLAALSQALGCSLSWPVLHVMLPVGISFYTFQALSYTIDVRRRTIAAEHSLIDYAAYLSFFPQLVAGPIERAGALLPQFRQPRSFDYSLAVDGTRRMLWGFFKKIAIADSCAATVQMIFDAYPHLNSLTLLYGALLFTFQIYADFSGYSDIAIGCAQLFGIRLSDNFRYPYFATSIPDFWRRWHISLTQWFRDYVYIPLGGSRCARHRIFGNTLTVFALSGLWHGAAWKFVVWGLYHGLLFLPSIIRGKAAQAAQQRLVWVRRLVTFMLVMVGWVIFRADTPAIAWHYITGLFTLGFGLSIPYSKYMMLPICLMLAAEWYNRDHRHALARMPRQAWLRMLIYYTLCIFCLWFSGQGTQFIYFQF